MSEKLPGTQKEAKENGHKYYFTGKPCKHGHISKRSVTSGNCLECRKTIHKEAIAKYRRCRAYTIDFAKRNRFNDETIKTATNHRQAWTIDEINILMAKEGDKYVYTERELTRLLGRSYRGVMRSRNRYSDWNEKPLEPV